MSASRVLPYFVLSMRVEGVVELFQRPFVVVDAPVLVRFPCGYGANTFSLSTDAAPQPKSSDAVAQTTATVEHWECDTREYEQRFGKALDEDAT